MKLFLGKTIIILGAVALFAWTAWQNAAPSGVFEARYDFAEAIPFITGLSPGDRVGSLERDSRGDAYQTIIDDPVYFRVRAPRHFDRAWITVRYQNPSQQPLAVGGLVDWNTFQFDLKPLRSDATDDWQTVTVAFDLAPLRWEGRTLTFAFSAPEMKIIKRPVQISEIKVRLERSPFFFEDLWDLL
ncbi:hypothetical protein HY628_01140 [Candidatus Uhrbacteria bacterium]|nr:hypothetical protein [Candidatus Uhrbacteria bacterium]